MGVKMNKIKAIYKYIKLFVSANDAEITAIISAFFIVYPSFLINKELGYYVLGLVFALLTVFLLKYPR